MLQPIFESINAISVEATKILHRPVVENGDSEKLVNGGSGTSTSGAYCNEHEHQSLQVPFHLIGFIFLHCNLN